MSSKQSDNDIDRLFKSAVEPIETEPSDKFWNKAYDDIIKRESQTYNTQATRWKFISYGLAAAVVIMAFYIFYTNSRITTIEKQITEVEKKQAGTTSTGTGTTGAATTTVSNKTINAGIVAAPSTSTTIAQTSTLQDNNNTTSPSVTKQVALADNKAYNNNISNNTNATVTSNIDNNKVVNSVVKNYSNPGGDNVETPSTPVSGSSYVNQSAPGAYYSKPDSNASIATNNKINAPTTPSQVDSLTVVQQTPALNAIKKDSTVLTENVPANDTLSLKDKRKMASRIHFNLANLFVAAFFSPELGIEAIKDNDTWNSVTPDDIKTHENEQFNYTTGIKIGYDISKHLSVLAGLFYHSSSFSVAPTVIHAQWYNNQIGYPIITSAGNVEVPCPGYQTYGDSIKAFGSMVSSYISIPLQAKYIFNPANKLSFYLDAGVAINFLTNNSFSAHWQTTQLTEGFANVPSCQGLQNNFYSYNVGFGVTYKLAKMVSVFGEPEFRGAFTPTNSNTEITTYPYTFGLELGLICHI